MIKGILIGKIDKAPQSFTTQGGSGSLTGFTVRRMVTAGGKTFPTFFKVVMFGAAGKAVDELCLSEGDWVAVSFRDMQCEVYESRKNPRKWQGSVKVVASSVERVGRDAGESGTYTPQAPYGDSVAPTRGIAPVAPPQNVPAQGEPDEDVPF